MGYPLKKWKDVTVDQGDVSQLASSLGVSRVAAEILTGRGFKSADDAESYMNPKLSGLGDPFDIPGVRKAVDCIWAAIDAGKRIAVFGDFDADGITSAALLVTLLQKLGADAVPFLPDRQLDGYGMNMGPVKRCLSDCKPELIISADCGTNSVEAVSYAMEAGVEVVVTDHHEPQENVADPTALVNPKVAGADDLKALAGVGVAFRLCHGIIKLALAEQRPESQELDLRDWLDFVAVGTVADIVPLTGENRILVRYGLQKLNQYLESSNGRPCWDALRDTAKMNGAVEPYHIGFVIAPRLNSAGRLGSPVAALDLLLSGNKADALEKAMELEDKNRKRRQIEASISKAAAKQIDEYFDEDKTFGIVAWAHEWHVGINGIVASRLSSKYGRPVVVVAVDGDGKGVGSSRSIECIDVLEALNGCADLLNSYGGHKMAAGLEVEEANLEAFRERFNEICAQKLRGQDLRSVQAVDSWVSLSELGDAVLQELDRMQPFGLDNPEPVLGVRGVTLAGKPKVIGKTQDHIKMTVTAGGAQLEAVGFGLGAHKGPEGKLDMIFRLKDNTFRDQRLLQMHILDIRESA
ncbi:single-stranded-DNA-specific exonuclease RecJ [bacterium E08(2017)]|nr:single-stranded-DNA-specific exonuclease RecJ [bacterium E08(2017)]